MKKYTGKKILTFVLQLLGMAVLVIIDLLIKQKVVDSIALYEDVKFIDGIIGFTYVRNTGMAWSLFDSNPALLSVFTGILLFAVLVYLALPKKRPLAYDILIPLIAAGGAANMIERIMRGYVVDYIKTLFVNFPVYNFADILITVSAAVLMIYLIYEIVTESKNEKKEACRGKNK